jgi:hypothetical protein
MGAFVWATLWPQEKKAATAGRGDGLSFCTRDQPHNQKGHQRMMTE